MDITEGAKEKLANMLMGRGGTKGSLRLVLSSSGNIGLVLDRQSENDLIVEHLGMKILFVDRGLATRLDDATLDVQEEEGFPSLVLKRMQPAALA
ncbi:MAG: hypothetical protein HYX87_03855 [Chloroflexi bacterium]|nr:hypothetical protein [Chloroflexota bacterium]